MIHFRRDERGEAALELPLVVGLLLLPIAVLVMSIPAWPERQTIATAAAREAASLYANAATPEAGLEAAQRAVGETATNHGLMASALTLELSGDWCRGCSVSAVVTVEIPALSVPFVGEVGSVNWSATSSARIDDYASLEEVTP